MRFRVTFAKTEAMRFTGHLDLFRTWERTIRRARLPLAYSQGFRPHPRINLASALPLGFTSEQELADIWLEQPLPIETVEASLKRAAPPGISILKLEEVDLRTPALQSQVEASVFILTFPENTPDLERQVEELMAADHLERIRRGKVYDLRSLILTLDLLNDSELGRTQLQACLQAREGATGRPEEVVLALGGQPETVRFHRKEIILRED